MFNLLGPMANPGRVRRQVIGVADARFAERMLASLRAHGSTDAWIVHGGGLDELTTTGPSTVLALEHDGSVRTFEVDPVALGFAPATHEQLVGGDPAHNADVVRRVLAGERGPHRDIVVLNAAAALVVAAAAESLPDGVDLAAAAIDSGKAAATLDVWIAGVPSSGRMTVVQRSGVERQSRSGIRRPRNRPRHPRPGRPRRRVDGRRRARRSRSTSTTRRGSPSPRPAARALCGCVRRSRSVAVWGSAGRCESAARPSRSCSDSAARRWWTGTPTCSRWPPLSKATPTTWPPRCTAASSPPTGHVRYESTRRCVPTSCCGSPRRRRRPRPRVPPCRRPCRSTTRCSTSDVPPCWSPPSPPATSPPSPRRRRIACTRSADSSRPERRGLALRAGLDAGAWCGWLSGSGPTVAFLAAAGRRRSDRRCPAGGWARPGRRHRSPGDDTRRLSGSVRTLCQRARPWRSPTLTQSTYPRFVSHDARPGPPNLRHDHLRLGPRVRCAHGGGLAEAQAAGAGAG